MDTVSFWKKLGKTDKMNKAVEEVEKYQKHKELLESEAEKLANTDIEETESFKKRRTLINSLLNEEKINDDDGDMNPHNISVQASPGSNVSTMTLQTVATTTTTTRGDNHSDSDDEWRRQIKYNSKYPTIIIISRKSFF